MCEGQHTPVMLCNWGMRQFDSLLRTVHIREWDCNGQSVEDSSITMGPSTRATPLDFCLTLRSYRVISFLKNFIRIDDRKGEALLWTIPHIPSPIKSTPTVKSACQKLYADFCAAVVSKSIVLLKLFIFPGISMKIRKMLLTFQDRVHLFRGVIGTKQFSLEALLPVVLLPLALGVAAINIYCSIVVCIAAPLFLGYTYHSRRSIAPRTKFFFLWAFWSIVYLWIIFEATVPLLELLPEENFIFVTCAFVSIFFLYKVREPWRGT